MHDALDVWLRFLSLEQLEARGYDTSNPGDIDLDEPEAEANTFPNGDGTYRVEWYLTAVGQVSIRDFQSVFDAYQWLENEGFAQYG